MKKMLSPTLLTKEQSDWVKNKAQKEGESMATVVRNLINKEIQMEKTRAELKKAEGVLIEEARRLQSENTGGLISCPDLQKSKELEDKNEPS